jgi:hypothetical protein
MDAGHEKNVANFETVIIILISLGAIYDPSQALILLPALQALLTLAKNAIDAVTTAEAADDIAIDERQEEFSELYAYAVNIKRAVIVEINDDAFTKDVNSLVGKFRSKGKNTDAPDSGGDQPATGGEPAPAAGRSTSERSYDMQIQHLTAIRELVKAKSASYAPPIAAGEDDVTIHGIEAKINALETKNNNAKNTKINLGLALNERDRILYNPAEGVIKRITLIKNQLARKPGKQSAAYQQIMALDFKKY